MLDVVARILFISLAIISGMMASRSANAVEGHLSLEHAQTQRFFHDAQLTTDSKYGSGIGDYILPNQSGDSGGNNTGLPIIIVGLAFIASSAWFLVNTVLEVQRSWRSSSWAQVQGKIIASEVTNHGGGEDLDHWNPNVNYEYVVDGVGYESAKVKFGRDSGWFAYGGLSEAKIYAEVYSIGREVIVHYDPIKPSNCVLRREMRVGQVLFDLFLSLAAVPLGTVFILSGLKFCLERLVIC